ncbi:hypothetical protein ACFLYZ_01940 [Thermodesulfobacteriota bacterium]
MIPLGSSKRLCVGGWILVVLILCGLNGFALSSLFSPPVAGHSKETRLASQKLHRLKNKLFSISKESFDNIDPKRVAERFSPEITVVKKTSAPPPATKNEFEAEPETPPPVLTGTMKVLDSFGKQHSSVLIEGRQLKANDRIRGFTIKKITNQGVELSKDGKTWFVPAPAVYFSLDRKSEANQDDK